jgi:hypothetical protein
LNVEVLKQFSVFLPNKPGALSALAGLLADKGINILGIASEVRDDSGLVRLAVGGQADISHILSKAGFASVETTLLSVEVTDRPGELARITKVLSDGKINITTVYGTAILGHTARILISVQNADAALKLLTNAK